MDVFAFAMMPFSRRIAWRSLVERMEVGLGDRLPQLRGDQSHRNAARDFASVVAAHAVGENGEPDLTVG